MCPYNIDRNSDRPLSLKMEQTTLWAVNGTKIPQYSSIIFNIKHKDSATIQGKYFVRGNDITILGV